jgi:hypothetical protein
MTTEAQGEDDDRIVMDGRRPTYFWRLALVWFMRLAALVWLIKGLLWWSEIIGFGPGLPFEERRLVGKAIAVGFAITDIIAAVGLWLVGLWGALIWLLSMLASAILSIAYPDVLPATLWGHAILLANAGIYLALTALAAQEGEDT